MTGPAARPRAGAGRRERARRIADKDASGEPLAPGWYKDPADPTTQRWWDGEGWVGDPLPADATPPPGPPPERPSRPAREPSDARAARHDDHRQCRRAGAEIPARRPTGKPPTERLPGPGARPGRARPGRVAGGLPGRMATPLASPGARLLARLIDIGAVFLLNVAVNGWFVYQYWLEIRPMIAEAWRRAWPSDTAHGRPAAARPGRRNLSS